MFLKTQRTQRGHRAHREDTQDHRERQIKMIIKKEECKNNKESTNIFKEKLPDIIDNTINKITKKDNFNHIDYESIP